MKKYCTWNGITADGFVAVPRVFLRNYRKLGLSHSDALLVIEIMSYCWCDGSEHLPFPQLKQLGEALEMHERNVRHALNKLRKAGLLTTTRKMHNLVYDFSGLFAKLAEFVDKSKQKGRPITVASKVEEPAAMRFRLKPKSADEAPAPVPQRAAPPAAYNTHKEEHEKESLRDSGGPSMTPTPLRPEEPFTKRDNPLGKDKRSVSAEEGLAKAKAILDKFAVMPVPNRVPIKQAGGKRFVFDDSKKLSAYTAHDILAAYRICWRDSMECAPPAFSKKDMALSKKILNEYGAEYVLSYFVFCFRNWEALSKRLEVIGDPSLALLYGYRNSLSALHRDPSRMETQKWGSNYKKSDKDDFELE